MGEHEDGNRQMVYIPEVEDEYKKYVEGNEGGDGNEDRC
jgi:hypothetical protein